MLLFQRGLLFIPFKSQSIMHYYVQVLVVDHSNRVNQVKSVIVQARSKDQVKAEVIAHMSGSNRSAGVLMSQPATDQQLNSGRIKHLNF